MGLAPTTVFVVLPFTQVMMIDFVLLGIAGAAGVFAFGAGVDAAGADGVVVGLADTALSCESLIRIVGWEKVKL